MTKKIGVMLSGCGVYDGSEIQEAVFVLLAIDRAGAKAVFLAPDVEQMHVIDHKAGHPATGQTRNVLVESARIARGDIADAATVKTGDLDALVFPGGFGAAKNLCTFAVDGPKCDVHPEVARLVREMHAAKKPLGFACIAPALGAKVLGAFGVRLTIGNDAGTAGALEALGARHVEAPVTECVVDEVQRVVSAPAYMYGNARPGQVCEGIDKMVRKVIELAS
ncbi:MAG: isoprenoid biosynthesis glyoxalase ElbB [Candidatus Sumerlaeia bacterium]|nr:isoprenoid biosynthesis glyoxalase ElbB [Candidatus Sumerlaeia bacterium]